MITARRLLGSIYGQAIGDCMGEVAEGCTAEEIRARFGYITGFTKRPEFTDDTILTHLSAAAIIDNGLIVDRRRIAAVFLEHFDSIPRMGPTTKATLLAYQTDPGFLPHAGSTNGAAMRAPAIAWLFGNCEGCACNDDAGTDSAGTHGAACDISDCGVGEELIRKAAESSLATHGADISIKGACAVACAVSCACAGWPLSSVISAGIEGAGMGWHDDGADSGCDLSATLQEAAKLGMFVSPDEVVRRFGCGIETEETLPLVFYILGQCSDRVHVAGNTDEGIFRDAILTAVNMGGDTDTVAGIVGAIMGGWAGIDNIPHEWVDAIDAEGFASRFGIDSILHVRSLRNMQGLGL